MARGVRGESEGQTVCLQAFKVSEITKRGLQYMQIGTRIPFESAARPFNSLVVYVIVEFRIA